MAATTPTSQITAKKVRLPASYQSHKLYKVADRRKPPEMISPDVFAAS